MISRSNSPPFIWLKRTLEPPEYQRIAAFIERDKIHGLNFLEESRRVYPNDMLAAHAVLMYDWLMMLVIGAAQGRGSIEGIG